VLTTTQAAIKRTFDFFLAGVALFLTWWIIAIAWALASWECRSNGIFRQLRVGRHGKLFYVNKIRTMRVENMSTSENELPSSAAVLDSLSTTVTTKDDPRITRLGRIWRKTKIDELPQLLNVLRGEMSFVGPRPDVPGFADELKGDDRVILSVRPGITGPATLKYRNEEELLASVDDPERYNREVIFPDKVRLNRLYAQNWSFWKDLIYIFWTLWPGPHSPIDEANG